MKSNIKVEVKKLISEYNTRNPFELIDYLDILLVKYPLPNSLRGYHSTVSNQAVICINSQLSYEDSLLAAAHELGHFILHPNMNVSLIHNHTYLSVDKYELQADMFAAELLLQDNIFEEYEGYSMDFISKSENISYKFIKYKQELSNIIS